MTMENVGGYDLNRDNSQNAAADVSPEFLTVDDLAARWSLSVSFIRKLIRNGELQATHFGSAVRIAVAEADRFIRESQGGGNGLG